MIAVQLFFEELANAPFYVGRTDYVAVKQVLGTVLA
jgi:hypothetical protein